MELKPDIIILGDTQLKEIEPYYSGNLQLFDWLAEKYSYASVIQVGDFFDKSSPHHEKIADAFIEKILKFKEFHIVSGNHDMSRHKGNALIPLRHHKSIEVYTKPTTVTIEGCDFLMLPFIEKREKLLEYETIKTEAGCKHVVCHFTPQPESFDDEGIELRGIRDSTIFWGHIHLRKRWVDANSNVNELVGVPQTTRKGEETYPKRVIGVFIEPEGVTYKDIEVPEFMTIKEIEYGDAIENKKHLYDILDAPSVAAVHQMYPFSEGYHIRDAGIAILRTKNEDSDFKQDELDLGSLEEKFIAFAKEKEQPKEVVDTVLSYMEKVK